MEAVKQLEELFRGEMTRLRQDLRGFHLRVIKLENELRSSRQRNVKLKRMLTAEREQRQCSGKKLERQIRDLCEITEEVQSKCDDIEERIVEMERTGDLRGMPGVVNLDTHFDTEAESMMNGLGENVEMPERVDAQVQAVVVDDIAENEQVLNSNDEEGVVAPETGVECQNPMIFIRSSDSVASSPRMSQITEYPAPTFASMSPIASPPPPLFEDNDFRVRSVTPPPVTPTTPPPVAKAPPAEDSDSGIDESTKRTPKRKQDTRWKLKHGVDPHNPSSLTCICGTQLPTKKGLNEHIRYYTEKWRFPCNICKKHWPRLNVLRKHQARVHKVIFDEAVKGKSFGCRKCSKICNSKGELIRHRRLCTQRSPTPPEVAASSGGTGTSSMIQMDVDYPDHRGNFSPDRVASSCPSSSPILSGFDYDPDFDLDFTAEVQEGVHKELMEFINNAGGKDGEPSRWLSIQGTRHQTDTPALKEHFGA